MVATTESSKNLPRWRLRDSSATEFLDVANRYRTSRVIFFLILTLRHCIYEGDSWKVKESNDGASRKRVSKSFMLCIGNDNENDTYWLHLLLIPSISLWFKKAFHFSRPVKTATEVWMVLLGKDVALPTCFLSNFSIINSGGTFFLKYWQVFTFSVFVMQAYNLRKN